MKKIKNIFFDFDGVIIDSMEIRDFGFKEVFKEYKGEKLDKLIAFHRENGGFSRYVKIKYFYEEILKTSIAEKEILSYAEKFSEIMKKELIKPRYLIQETVDFIKSNMENIQMHIVSGSDDKELKFLCKKLKISNCFISINGSPTPKDELVKNIMKKYMYNNKETILIGDSKNDYDAAFKNNIDFHGYNNENIKNLSENYIKSFVNFKILQRD